MEASREFLPLLQVYDLNSFDRKTNAAVGIWPTYRLAYLNTGWPTFALANGGDPNR